ncbi:MAG: hypothetical protein AAF721_26585 [Myxococcota bacterium]
MVATLAACRADYDGDAYPPVVRASEVELRDSVPDGFRVIGTVSAEEENVVNGNSLIQVGLHCRIEDRLVRQMKRSAADSGGELLVAVDCYEDAVEDTSRAADDPTTDEIETELTCFTACTAEVARAFVHDE